MANHLSRVQAGDVVSAAGFNHLVDATRQNLHFTAAAPLVLERTPGGVLLRLAKQTSLKFVLLDEDVAAGDTDRAGHVLDYDPQAPAWLDTTVSPGFSPQEVDKVTDPFDTGLYLAGERRLVYFDRESGCYLPLDQPGPHLVVCTEDIDRGSSGTVTVQRIDSEGEVEDTSLELTAYNLHHCRIWADAPGMAVLHPQSRRWYLTQVHSATKLLAFVNESGGVTGADATFAVDGIIPLDGVFSETTISDVTNSFLHTFDDDAQVALVWNESTLAWETWQGECPSSAT